MKNLVIREEVYDLQISKEKFKWHIKYILGREISPISSHKFFSLNSMLNNPKRKIFSPPIDTLLSNSRKAERYTKYKLS